MAGRTVQSVREAAIPVDVTLWSALAALADPVRLRIFLLLREREQCVCHLTEALGLSQGTISYHIGMLKRARLVRDRRDPLDARWVYYRLDPARMDDLRVALAGLLDIGRTDTTPADCHDRGKPCLPNTEGEV